MAIIFIKHPHGYPRYRLSYDTSRGEIVLQMEAGKHGDLAQKIYLDEGMIKALVEYASEAGLT